MRPKVLLIALVLVGTALGAAHTTQAAYSDCGGNRVCLWGNNDFRWLIGQRSPGYGWLNLSGDRDDEMDSWANRTGTTSAAYSNYDGHGECQVLWRYSSDDNVAPWNSDQVSSWRTNGGC